MSYIRRRKRLTNDKIVLEAIDSFQKHGYAQTTLAKIAEKLSVTDKALYYYFTSKDALYLESVNVCAERVAALIAATDATRKSGLAKLKCYVRAALRQPGILYPYLYPYDIRLPPHLTQTAQATRFYERKRSNEETVIRWIREGIDDGSIVPANPKLLWRWNEGALVWLGIWSPASGEADMRALEDQIMIMMDRALARSAAPDDVPPHTAA